MNSVLHAFEPATVDAIERVARVSVLAASDETSRWLKDLVLEAVRAAAPPRYIRWIKAGTARSVKLLDVEEIMFFKADQSYTLVAMADTEMLIRKSLVELRRELDPACWWTIHRSTIVNVRAISEVRHGDDGRAVVSLRQRSELLPVSEANASQFRQM